MVAAMRESTQSSLLPTIKCSQCGDEVEISMMGEHICARPINAEPSEPIKKIERFDNQYSLSPPPEESNGFDDHLNLAPPGKQGRKPSPVDTGVANKSYMNPGALTPISQPSHTPSPRTPIPSPDPANELFFTSTAAINDSPLESSPVQNQRPGQNAASAPQAMHTTEPIPSPGLPTTPTFQQRMDTMTRGPFEAYHKPSGADNLRRGSPSSHLGEPFRPQERPGTANSSLSNRSQEGFGPPKVPSNDGYEGFGPPLRGNGHPNHPSLSMSRSQTFPKPSYALPSPERTSSAQGIQAHRFGGGRTPPMGPDTSRKPPPRTSLIPTAKTYQNSVDLSAEFGVGNPYHAHSASTSSGYLSGFSQRSSPSSHSSPARSNTAPKFSDSLFFDKPPLQDSWAPSSPHLVRQDSMPNSPTKMLYNDQSTGARQSPNDLFSNHFGKSPPSPHYSSSPLRGPHMGLNSHGSSHDLTSVQPGSKPTSRPGSRDPGSRGDCKACGHPITGKSISSADGRLTGKYHKSCFVCTTCSEPFMSAEFYVLGDKPYCEQHYHSLNGSLCGGCHRGIEGQYVEDEVSAKYHPRCFCCLDCGRSLSDGYFEVDGKSYCEQDAWNRTQPAMSPPLFNGGGYAPQVDHQLYQQYPPPPRRGPGSWSAPPRSPRSPPRMQQGGYPGPGRPGPGPGGPQYPGPGQRPMGGGRGGMPRPPYGPGPPHGMDPRGMRPPQGRPPPPRGPPSQRPMMNKRATRVGMMGPA